MVKKKATKKTTKKAATRKRGQQVVYETPAQFTFGLEIVGDEQGLLMHDFSQKSFEEMLAKQVGYVVERQPKKINECIEQAITRNTAGVVSMPTVCMKKAIRSAAYGKDNVPKGLRRGVWIVGGSIPITYEKMEEVVHPVMVGPWNKKVKDLRFRPLFLGWKARFVVQHSENIPLQALINLINEAGRGGWGEWRPSKGDGSYGTFTIARAIDDPKEMAEITKICKPAIRPLVIPEWARNAEIDPKLLSKVMQGDDGTAEEEEKGQAFS
jgi:hypothetical protein